MAVSPVNSSMCNQVHVHLYQLVFHHYQASRKIKLNNQWVHDDITSVECNIGYLSDLAIMLHYVLTLPYKKRKN